jgi:thiol-disulfide isomerase/thioredoxin
MKATFPLIHGFILSVSICISMGIIQSQAQPANDNFASRILITGTNLVVTGSNVRGTKEAGEPNHAGINGGASVWWSWTAPTVGTATISTAGSSFDTVLGVYTGLSVSALTAVASNDDDPAGGLTSKVTFSAVSNQTYQIAVDGYGGLSGSISLSVQLVAPSPPPQAPAWVMPDPYGVMVNSSDYAGKVVVLNFWATWCGPCKAEMPDLVTLQDKYRADGLVIVGADGGWSGDTPSVVQSFLATWTPAINYQIVMASSAMVQAYGGVAYIPDTFIIDRQNIIRKTFVGSQSLGTFEQAVFPLLYNKLTFQNIGNQLTVCWITNVGPSVLESATNFANPVWSEWPVAPTVVNGTNTVSIPATGSPRYFRLRMPY